MNDKIFPGNEVRWLSYEDWCDLLIIEGVTEDGTFTAQVIATKGFESHIGSVYDDWLPEHLQ